MAINIIVEFRLQISLLPEEEMPQFPLEQVVEGQPILPPAVEPCEELATLPPAEVSVDLRERMATNKARIME